jgi:hypothetical protein
MSIVAVHGPNTMFTTQGGGASIPSSGGGVAQATKDVTNGLKFAFSVPNPGARPAADFDWTFTGPGSPAAQPDKFSGTVTFTGAGAVTIICTVAAGVGPPAGGTYTVTAAATAGTPRMVEQGAPPDEPPPDDGEFDPGDHTIAEVEDYVNAHPDQAQAVYDLEIDGKQRVTLITWLEEFEA